LADGVGDDFAARADRNGPSTDRSSLVLEDGETTLEGASKR
jgi:hypothetical protein